jgi:hypothetical protein
MIDPRGHRLGIVVPVYNEGDGLLFWLQEVESYLVEGDQLVVVDATEVHPDDSNVFSANKKLKEHIANHPQLHYLRSKKGRAVQMNAGADFLSNILSGILYNPESENPQSDFLWFLHCDSGLSDQHFLYLRSLKPTVVWGRFDVQLIPNIFPFYIISKFMNMRSRLTQVVTGDQGIFIRSDIFQQLGGYAPISLMEDIEISKRLRKIEKSDCDGPRLKTSARRWQQHGWVKTVLLMWQLRLMYWLGVSPDKLVKKYYGK